jgi:TolA-binding protein
MTLPELHPDELLRRVSHDRITLAGRADLSAHIVRCPACALEVGVRGDAARAGISSEQDHAIAARIVERVLASKEPAHALPAGARWRGRLARAAVVALLLTSTAVGAAVIAVRLNDRRPASPARDAQTTPPTIAASPRSHRAREAIPYAPIPTAPEPPTMDPPAPANTMPAFRPHAGESAARPRVSAPIADAPTAAPAALQPPALGGSAAGPGGAAVILTRAEAARAARCFGDAARLYQELAARFPDSREEIVARVLHGQLLLDEMHDAPAALRSFERYLASEPAGSLAEEARLGRAQALQRAGARDEERAAWEDLLRRHPASVYAAAARERLATLRAP